MKTDRLATVANTNRFVTEKAEGQNNSGLEPIGTKVLVLTDQVATTSAGGLHLPEEIVERQTMAITTGTLVAIGGAAFTDWPNSTLKWPGAVPQIGSRIHMARYCGIVIEGKDGLKYRLCQDSDLAGMEV